MNVLNLMSQVLAQIDPILRRGNTVGGVTMPINTLAILAPYIALAGLAIAISTVVLVKKRRD